MLRTGEGGRKRRRVGRLGCRQGRELGAKLRASATAAPEVRRRLCWGKSGELGASPRLWTAGDIGPGSSAAPGSFSLPRPSRPQPLCRLARPRFPAGAGGAHEAAPGSRAAACPAGRDPAAAAPVRAAVGAGNPGTRPPSRTPSAAPLAPAYPCLSLSSALFLVRFVSERVEVAGARVDSLGVHGCECVTTCNLPPPSPASGNVLCIEM